MPVLLVLQIVVDSGMLNIVLLVLIECVVIARGSLVSRSFGVRLQRVAVVIVAATIVSMRRTGSTCKPALGTDHMTSLMAIAIAIAVAVALVIAEVLVIVLLLLLLLLHVIIVILLVENRENLLGHRPASLVGRGVEVVRLVRVGDHDLPVRASDRLPGHRRHIGTAAASAGGRSVSGRTRGFGLRFGRVSVARQRSVPRRASRSNVEVVLLPFGRPGTRPSAR